MRKEYLVCGALALVAMAFLLGSAGIFLLIMGSALGFYALVSYQQVKLNQRAFESEIRNRETDAEFRHVVVARLGVLSYNRGELSFWSKREIPDRNAGGLPEPEEQEPENSRGITALDVARHMDRVIMAGATRSGKTFCSKQIAYLKLRQGQTVIALDPKPIRSDDTWPQGVRLYGPDDNYAEIADALNWIDDEVSRRAKDFDNISKYPKVLIFWDEIADMLYDVPEFVPRYLKILRKYAEYRIDLFIITQSDDYSSCGLPNAQLKRNFRAVLFFEHDEYVGRRKVFYNNRLKMPTTPETAQELIPFRPVSFPAWKTDTSRGHGQEHAQKTHQNAFTAERDTMPYLPAGTGQTFTGIEPEAVSRVYESRDEKTICEMWRDGHSLNEIARTIWGTSNGRRTAQIKAILENNGFVL